LVPSVSGKRLFQTQIQLWESRGKKVESGTNTRQRGERVKKEEGEGSSLCVRETRLLFNPVHPFKLKTDRHKKTKKRKDWERAREGGGKNRFKSPNTKTKR